MELENITEIGRKADKQLWLITDMLDSMSESDLVDVYNEYAEKNKYGLIYQNTEYEANEIFNNMLNNMGPYELMQSCSDYSYADEWMREDGYGNIESTNELDRWIDLDELAEYIYENNDCLRNEEIQSLLEEFHNDDLEIKINLKKSKLNSEYIKYGKRFEIQKDGYDDLTWGEIYNKLEEIIYNDHGQTYDIANIDFSIIREADNSLVALVTNVEFDVTEDNLDDD